MVSAHLSVLQLDPGKALRRIPPRPMHLRQPCYDEEFDFLTVFYDCFSSAGGQWVILTGPPLANLQLVLIPILCEAFSKQVSSDFIVRNMDRHSQIWVRTAKRDVLVPDGTFAQKHLVVHPNQCELFDGKRVVFTKSKDNDLQWIRDWAWFHARKHGCNSVLLYDNGSTRYDLAEIVEVLKSVNGLDVVVVVDWPYKFGPHEPRGKPWLQSWDSDFCQYGILEHARHRFLALADAVVNADIDELTITKDRTSVFELVRRSKTGYLRYPGIWIEDVSSGAGGDDRRHANFVHTAKVPALPKWTVAPQRCHLRWQWRVHDVGGMPADFELSAKVLYRHFRAINTGWRGETRDLAPPSNGWIIDEHLVEWMRSLHD